MRSHPNHCTLQKSYEWHEEKAPRKPRVPWAGLTPEEAYRKGVQDGKAEESEQERLRDEHANPKHRTYC